MSRWYLNSSECWNDQDSILYRRAATAASRGKNSRSKGTSALNKNVGFFKISDDGKTLIEYRGSATRVCVPDGIVNLSPFAFSNSAVEDVVLPDSVQNVGAYCFWSSRLKKIRLSSSLRLVERSAFQETQLTNVVFPPQCTKLEGFVLSGNQNLRSLTLPDSLKAIDDYPFVYCCWLKEIRIAESNPFYKSGADGALYSKDGKRLIAVPGGYCGPFIIPDSVEELEPGCFIGCWFITEIVVPKGLRKIRFDKVNFRNCRRLTRFYVNGISDYFTTKDGVLLSKNGSQLLACPEGKTADVYTVPSSVREIAPFAFDSCNSIGVINIPSTVQSVDDASFIGCNATLACI